MPFLNDLQICDLLQAQYDGNLDRFDYSNVIQGVTFSVKAFPGEVHLVLEGSHNILDAERDLEADIIFPAALGGDKGVHAGFWRGLTAAIDDVAPILPKDILLSVEGHSLGAGRVNPAVAYLKTLGYTMMQRRRFAPPRSNDSALEGYIAEFPDVAYFNYGGVFSHDLIVDLPRRIMPYFPYFTDYHFKFLNSPPADDDLKWGVFSWHHLYLYRNALAKLFPSAAA